MKKINYLGVIALSGGMLLASCNKDKDFKVEITGLENLGADYMYEGWIMVDGAPLSTGTFSVNDAGAMSSTTFPVGKKDMKNATAFILSIEPTKDPDPAPSNVKILAGDFSGDEASLVVSHSAALGTNFSAATGTYILATPTDGSGMTDENSGVWFFDPTAGPAAGLDLPTLPTGWQYEGWAVIDGAPISTGTFTSATGSDASAPYSGSSAGPAFPGEDFLMNAPTGVTFPTDLAGKTVVISVEPVPDNSAAPFLLKPLVGPVSASAVDHTPYTMNNNSVSTNPTGTASRN